MNTFAPPLTAKENELFNSNKSMLFTLKPRPTPANALRALVRRIHREKLRADDGHRLFKARIVYCREAQAEVELKGQIRHGGDRIDADIRGHLEAAAVPHRAEARTTDSSRVFILFFINNSFLV